MRIKLYLDEDAMRNDVVRGLRARGVDVTTAMDAGLMSSPDEEQLLHAASQQRVVFTFNRRDFVLLHVAFLESGRHHAGIVVANQAETGVVVRRLLSLVDARSAEDLQDGLEFLGNWR